MRVRGGGESDTKGDRREMERKGETDYQRPRLTQLETCAEDEKNAPLPEYEGPVRIERPPRRCDPHKVSLPSK